MDELEGWMDGRMDGLARRMGTEAYPTKMPIIAKFLKVYCMYIQKHASAGPCLCPCPYRGSPLDEQVSSIYFLLLPPNMTPVCFVCFVVRRPGV